MSLRYFALLCFLFLNPGINPVFSQNLNVPCGSDELRRILLEENPELNKIQKLAEDQYLEKIINGESSAQPNAIVTIPVAVHVIYKSGTTLGTAENLSDAQVKAGLDALNSILMGEPCAGNPAGNPTGIQLCLATQNSKGEATAGIDRFANNLTNMTITQTTPVTNLTGSFTNFESSGYLNIYIVKSITAYNPSGPADTVQGLATGSVRHGKFGDGIFIQSRFWYSPANVCQGGKVGAHQIGHYFDLFHTFEAGCPNDNCHLQGDRVCDTPPDNLGKTTGACGINNSCATDPDDDIYYNPFLTDQPDPENNFMDYSDQVCQTQFTPGQIERMNLSLTVPRRSLLTSIGCMPACTPYINAQIEVPRYVLTDSLMQFAATQVTGSILQWKMNGQPAGTGSVLDYTFNATGQYQLELEIGNGNGCTRTISTSFTVYKKCNLNAFIFETLPICYGGFVELKGYPGNGQWEVDGELSGNILESAEYPPGSTHIVRFTTYNDDCLQSVTGEITISQNSMWVSAQGAINCMNPQPVQVMVSSNVNGYYSWEDPLGNEGFSLNPVFSTSVGGNYQFELHNGASTCQGTYFIQTMNNQLDVKAENCNICANTNPSFPKISLCATSMTPGLNYFWSMGGFDFPGQEVKVSQAGTWMVEAINAAGCSAYSSVEVKSLVNILPQAVAGTDISWYCFQNLPRLNGWFGGWTPVDGGDISASWSTLDGNILPDVNPMNPRVNRPGTYVLTAVNNTSHCVYTDTALVVELSRKSVQTQTICAGESYEGHTSSGTYIRTVTYARSCDSIYTLNLTVLPPNTAASFQTICAGETFAGHSVSGNYVSHHTDYHGCDSTHTLHLTVLPANSAASAISICAGETYQGYSTAGSYINQYTDQFGCDSTHTLHLGVLPVSVAESFQTICLGATFDGYSATGIYVNHYTNFNGCDSTHTLHLNVLPQISSSSAQTICAGESLEGHNTSGTYVSSFTAINGCDSTHTLALTVLPANTGQSAQTICFGETFEGHTASGTYVSNFTGINGCDSTHTLALTVLPANTTQSAQTICFGETFEGHTASGTYVSIFTDINGCDSTHTLTLTVLPANTGQSAQTICFGETFEGHTTSGTYVSNFTDINGCDSTHTLDLTVLPQTIVSAVILSDNGTNSGSIEVVATGNGPFTYLWSNGSTTAMISGLQTGIYTVTVTGANNCTTQTAYEVPLSVAVTEADWAKDIRLFPNPLEVGDELHIQISEPAGVEICRVFDTRGRLIQMIPVTGPEQILHFQSTGVHWVQLLDKNGKSASWRVLVF